MKEVFLTLGVVLSLNSAERVTFLVSPDTHFTQAGGVADVEKNAAGILDMNHLAGNAYPSTSKWGGNVESGIRGVVIPGDLVDDGCNMKPANQTLDPGCVEQWGNYTSYFKVAPATPTQEGKAGEPTFCIYPTFEGVGNHVSLEAPPPTPAQTQAHLFIFSRLLLFGLRMVVIQPMLVLALFVVQ
jgi:hypothetical protein